MRSRRLAPRTPLTVVALLSAVALGCGASSASPDGQGERVGSSSDAIQGGQTDTGHSFAVGIFDQSAGGLCSGALIAPNLVVTARHCVAAVGSAQVNCATDTFGNVHAASSFGVTTDGQMSQNSTWYGVTKVIVPTDAHFCGNDLAMMVLDQNVPASVATPVTPGIEFPLTDKTHYARSLTAIGYGITAVGAQDEGTRRIKQDIPVQCIPGDAQLDCASLGATSDQVAASEFIAGSGTCSGDSGSSAFEQKSFTAGKPVTMGVLSRGGESGTSCLDSVYTRLDSFADLIRSTAIDAAKTGGYAPASWTNASPTDTSADGGTTPSDGTLGAPCSSNDHCDSKSCIAVGGTNEVCTQTCDPSNSSSCGDGFTCQKTDNGDLCVANPGDTPNGTTTTTTKSGCSVGSGGPSNPVPWFALVTLGLVASRRRRRR